MSQQPAQSPFTALAVTITGLLATVNTSANLINRTVNTLDQYAQTVERHAEDYNFQSKVVSAKRREQLEQQFKLLTPEQKKAMDNVDIFADVQQ